MKGRKVQPMPIREFLYPRRQENSYTSYSNVVSNVTYDIRKAKVSSSQMEEDDQILHDVAQLSLRTMREDEERRKRKEKQEEEECLRAIREAERIRMEQDSTTWTPVFRKAKASGKSQSQTK